MNLLLMATAVFGFGYIGMAFVGGLVCLWHSTESVPVVQVETLPAPVESIVSVEFLHTLGVRELRVRCTERQIPWKNANGKNKHLRKEQMVAVLAMA